MSEKDEIAALHGMIDILKAHISCDLQSAFISGAKFWEYHQTHGTMWQSDQQIVMQEAQKRYKN